MGIVDEDQVRAPPTARAGRPRREDLITKLLAVASLIGLASLIRYLGFSPALLRTGTLRHTCVESDTEKHSPYGDFPRPDDPFQFLPCTERTLPPPLNDSHPKNTWRQLLDPDPSHWNWGNKTTGGSIHANNPYTGRGIYLCGYIDVPLDYTNTSDPRITRLAVTKYQVSGLSLTGHPHNLSLPKPGTKSLRTIVISPGGPGGSGTSYAWRGAEEITKRLSNSTFDVLGWDPRGVNATLPALACFPYDADRDRWALLAGQYLEVSASPEAQLEVADAMSNATFRACWERHGDLPRFVSTAFVARDMEEVRKALGEDDLTGYLVSYGTGIGQTYVNMFPDSAGRIILDGTEYVRDHRLLGGFGWTALDNVTDAWRDGFLGECLNAGAEHCALAKSRDGREVRLGDLQDRMSRLVTSLVLRPKPGYTLETGPSLVTYSALIEAIYGSLYNAKSWPALAHMLYELEEGNSTLATAYLESHNWQYDPTTPCTLSPPVLKPRSTELTIAVICSDAYDAPGQDLTWWSSLWTNMTSQSWIAGNSRFFDVLPCRHFTTYWPKPAEVYRGDLNRTLKHPVLLIAEVYDPATPLRNGRRLLEEMGQNARLIAHHGYGHSSRDTSACTDSIARQYILTGEVPGEAETACYADEKPYVYGVKKGKATSTLDTVNPIAAWRDHLAELEMLNPS